jgi:hypothetical protein
MAEGEEENSKQKEGLAAELDNYYGQAGEKNDSKTEPKAAGVSQTILELEHAAPPTNDPPSSTAAKKASTPEATADELENYYGKAEDKPKGLELPPKPVPKTNLDLDACRDVVSKTQADREEQIQQEAPGNLPPPKPMQPIQKYREATPCKTAWEEMDGTGRVRFCKQCQLQAYDFSKMDLSEAEDLVFQRENKRAASFYKRKDGKFLTSDCPVGVRRRTSIILAVGVSAALVVLTVTMLSSLSPPLRPASIDAAVKAGESNTTAGAPAVKNTSGTVVTYTRTITSTRRHHP